MKIEIQRQGILFVLSAPSGGGKSTILKALRAQDSSLGYSVSATTRPPRASEQHGRDYYFYSEDQFESLIRQKAFYEWAHVHGYRYGTLRNVVDAELEKGLDVSMDIDVQGGLSIKRMRPDAVLVFLVPPSMEVLEQRLRGRKSDAEDVIALRLRNAQDELVHAPDYDYVVVNDQLDATVETVRSILAAERTRSPRLTVLKGGQDVRITASGLFASQEKAGNP